MKRFALVLLALVLGSAAYAETDYKSLPRVRALESRADDLETSVDAANAAIALRLLISDLVTSYTGTAPIVTTSYTPARAGVFLIGTVSNTVHISENATTNGWIQLAP